MTAHTHMRRVRSGTAPRRGSTLALLLAGLAAVSGCSSAEPASPKPSTPASPTTSAPAPVTPSPDSPEEAAKKQAVAAYRTYWAELTKAYAVPAFEGTDLKRYAVADALANAQETIANLKANKRAMAGAPVLSNPTVTGGELGKKTPHVSVSACLDVSGWKIVDKKTGKPAPTATNAVSKYVITSFLERWDGSWKVLKYELHADQPC